MKVVVDIETNSLNNPSKLWLVVCRCVESGELFIFRRLSDGNEEAKKEQERFLQFSRSVTQWIGHNIVEYDLPNISRLIDGFDCPSADDCIDTLILSRLIDYSREGGHSIEQYGKELGFEKIKYNDFTQYTSDMELYCIRDVDITDRIYRKYLRIILDPSWLPAIRLEHRFQLVVNDLHNNGFCFNVTRATKLLDRVTTELQELDSKILEAFPPREVLIREFIPKATKHGTISKTSVPRSLWEQIHLYEIGNVYHHTRMEPFNPSSHKQLITVLNEAGWKPENKTTTHINTERELNQLKRSRNRDAELDLKIELLDNKLQSLKESGWKVDETNLATLSETAPPPARFLAHRILLEARRRSLVEQLGCVCLEIKIKKENVGTDGIVRKEPPILNGANVFDYERRNGATNDQREFERLRTENNTLSVPTDFLSKNLIAWLRRNKVYADFVKENENYVWITITGLEQYEVFCAILAIEVSVGTKLKSTPFEITSERIKGKFVGLGAWTGRMSHQHPNTANIPTATKMDGTPKLLGKELRELWCAPRNRLLVGVDAEGIQLRLFAHIIDDAEFTEALVKGRKDDKTDPHSLNQRIIGSACKSREAAKRFIYALLLGGGLGKLAAILECSASEAREALDRILERYTGFAYVKQKIIPADARKGYFIGLDGRQIKIPDATEGGRRHLAMSGYLQSGEAIVIKKASLLIDNALQEEKALKKWMFVDIVHDEYVMEIKNDMGLATKVKKISSDAIAQVGVDLKLRCPLAGSGAIGLTWATIH